MQYKYLIIGLESPLQFQGFTFQNGENISSIDPYMLQTYVYINQIPFNVIDCIGVIKIQKL